MPKLDSDRKPGDMILDRYMPDANQTERESARVNMLALLATLVRIEERRASTSGKPDSSEQDERGRVCDEPDGPNL